MDGSRYRDGLRFSSATLTTPGARELTLSEEERLDEAASDELLGRQFRIGGDFSNGVRASPPCNLLAIERAPSEAGTRGRDEPVDVGGLGHGRSPGRH